MISKLTLLNNDTSHKVSCVQSYALRPNSSRGKSTLWQHKLESLSEIIQWNLSIMQENFNHTTHCDVMDQYCNLTTKASAIPQAHAGLCHQILFFTQEHETARVVTLQICFLQPYTKPPLAFGEPIILDSSLISMCMTDYFPTSTN